MNWNEFFFSDNSRQHYLRHGVFWLVFSLYYYAQGISPGCIKGLDPGDLFLVSFISVCCFLPASITSVYIMLGFIYPRYALRSNAFLLAVSCLLLFLVVNLVNFSFSFLFFAWASPTGLEGIPLLLILSLGFINSINAMLAAIFVAGIRFTRNLYGQRMNRHELLKKRKRMELQMARASIHPDFILECLENVMDHVSKDSDEAADIIIELSDKLSYSLYGEVAGNVVVAKG